MSNQNNTLPRSLSNQNNTSLRSPPQKKPYNNKPITPIKIVNGNQIIKQNEIINTDPDDLSSVNWTLVMSPHSQKRQHIPSPITSPTGNNTDIPVLNNYLIKRQMYLKIKLNNSSQWNINPT
jgi:hypothetical protein